ncbi:hypothetical protein SH449x_001991 [Pirellulaceae bacterium SH449]
MSGRSTKYAVPRENGTFLVSPPAHRWLPLLRRNQELSSGYTGWIRDVREKARREVSGYLGRSLEAKPLIVSGHQPEFFHTGVWFKNFVLHRLATSYDCVALNVQIDHDVVRDIGLSIPVLRSGRLSLATCKLQTTDRGDSLPWENTRCSPQIAEQWKEASLQLSSALGHFGIEPLIHTRWRECENLLLTCRSLAEVTTRLRELVENDSGLSNLEIPMSQLARGESFAEFVYRCLVAGREVLTVYNGCREDFRRERGISNPGQPVPELRQIGDWIEIPFWIYRTTEAAALCGDGSSRRQPAWVRLSFDRIEVASGPGESESIHLDSGRSLGAWCQAYQSWAEQGICIRPRALTTTLYLRLFLSDLFLHGIGGGVYDELTDQIAERLWQVSMPAFLVASASLHLPFGKDLFKELGPELGSSKAELEQRARQIRSAPESLLNLADPLQQALKARFDAHLANMPPRGQKKVWHGEMRGLRAKIRESISSELERWERQSLELIERERVMKIVRSREYSMAIFPEIPTVARLRSLSENSVCNECSSRESGSNLKDGDTSTLAAREC